MTNALIVILFIFCVFNLLSNAELRYQTRKQYRRLRRSNVLRMTEISTLDKKLETYISTDERVMELWPTEEEHGR
jgi:predicted PurR-regulated permease PerM